MRTFLLVLGLLGTLACQRSESPHEEHHHDEAGPSAVLESSESLGFRLAPQALQTLGIETLEFHGIDAIPASARVYSQDEIGVYRLRDGWFRLIHLDQPEELRKGDAIAVRGAAFLRVTDMSLFGDPIGGHHH